MAAGAGRSCVLMQRRVLNTHTGLPPAAYVVLLPLRSFRACMSCFCPTRPLPWQSSWPCFGGGLARTKQHGLAKRARLNGMRRAMALVQSCETCGHAAMLTAVVSKPLTLIFPRQPAFQTCRTEVGNEIPLCKQCCTPHTLGKKGMCLWVGFWRTE